MSELTDKLEELRILSRVDPQYLNKEYFDQLFSECIALSKAPLPSSSEGRENEGECAKKRTGPNGGSVAEDIDRLSAAPNVPFARHLDPASKEALADLLECLQHNGERERIACSAIWFNDGKEHPHQPEGRWNGFVVFGLGHHQCFGTLAAVEADGDIKKLPSEQGFVTTWNRFVSREEAAGLAFLAGQTHNGKYPKRLHSEDLFYKPRTTPPTTLEHV